MRFCIKTACNFLSFSGILNSLEDVPDEVNDGDQEVQPQTENPSRKKQKKQKKREYVQDRLIEIHQEHLAMLERSEKEATRIYGKNDMRTKRPGRERKGKRQDIFSPTRQIIY